MTPTKRKSHNVTIWALDMPNTQWRWACGCGVLHQGKPHDSRDAARAEAHAHRSAAERGV